MKTIILISFLLFNLLAKANMDCIYSSSKKGITVRYVSSCNNQQYWNFIDSFVKHISLKLNRKKSIDILVLINHEHLYHDFSGNPRYFISLGIDTLREIDSYYINDYCYARYGSTEESHPRPLNINSTDKPTSNKIGIKIIYENDYREPVNWLEVEKLIMFSALNLDQVRNNQKMDTVRHYSWYVSLPTIDTFQINKILGKTFPPLGNKIADPIKKEIPKSKQSLILPDLKYYIFLILTGIVLLVFILYKKHHS